MLDSLAFLPTAAVQEGMLYVRQKMPTDVSELQEIADYFDATYVSGTVRRLRPAGDGLLLRVRRTQPLFPPHVWNVHQATIDGEERTNNVCEGWNNAFTNMVGHHHHSLYTLLHALHQDQAVVATELVQDATGQPPAKRVKRSLQTHQHRLQNLCCDGRKTIAATLTALGHCVRLL